MKKVLIFSLAYYPHVGGAEIAIKELTDRITDIEWHMVTQRFAHEPYEERIGNVVVHRVGSGASYLSKILFIPRGALAARTLHRVHDFDAFWAMMSYMLFPIVLLRAFGNRTPYVLTLQEGDPFEHVFGRWFILPFRPLLESGFRNAAAVQAISNFLLAWARRAGFAGAGVVIPNGVDLARFSRARSEKPSTDIDLVTTSRLVHKNALDTVIRALPLLPANVHFSIYGIGPEEPMLRALAKELGVEARVYFKGHVDHVHLPQALAESDIFIRPSRSEGMGNSFVEAMAAGLPVIATQEGGIADFLFDAKRNPDKQTTGWAVDVDSPKQIAAAVEDILAHPEQMAKVTATASAMVREKYDWDTIARTMRELFGRVLASS